MPCPMFSTLALTLTIKGFPHQSKGQYKMKVARFIVECPETKL